MGPENLKTPGGIMRTNSFAFETGGTEILFEHLSRINHSCMPNVVKQRYRRKGEFVEFVVTATRDILAGEELFIDYGVPDGPVERRRAWLTMKYNFTCHCPACDDGRSRCR